MISVANLERGGQQRMALLLAECLASEHNVYFLVFSGKYKYGKYVNPEKVTFIDIDVGPEDLLIRKIFVVLKRVKIVRAIKKKYGIDISISFGETANIVNCLSQKKEKIITSIRGSMILENGITLIDRLTFMCSDKTVFISHGQRNAYAEKAIRYKDKLAVIYNACDVENIRKLSEEPVEEPFDEWTFVAVGRITTVKCFGNLINSFEIALSTFPQLRLYIIGGGDKKDELDKMVKAKGLSRSIMLIGDRDNPFAYMSKARGLLNSSGRESFSNVVLEGLACGVPVISTDCMFGPREIISCDAEYNKICDYQKCRYGILTPKFDYHIGDQPEREGIFAQAIICLLQNKELELEYRLKSKERCDFFSVNHYLNDWNDILFNYH